MPMPMPMLTAEIPRRQRHNSVELRSERQGKEREGWKKESTCTFDKLPVPPRLLLSSLNCIVLYCMLRELGVCPSGYFQ